MDSCPQKNKHYWYNEMQQVPNYARSLFCSEPTKMNKSLFILYPASGKTMSKSDSKEVHIHTGEFQIRSTIRKINQAKVREWLVGQWLLWNGWSGKPFLWRGHWNRDWIEQEKEISHMKTPRHNFPDKGNRSCKVAMLGTSLPASKHWVQKKQQKHREKNLTWVLTFKLKLEEWPQSTQMKTVSVEIFYIRS